MSTAPSQVATVVAFWREAGPRRWFKKDPAFDAEFRGRFLALHERAAVGELDQWATSSEGALALLILLDQFPRNAFRGTARMYATDDHARRIAHAALERQLDGALPQELRNIVYLPLMHSENPRDQALSVSKTAALGGEPHRYALQHQGIIDRFGRFPHRNALLGRTPTAQEKQFMAEGGFAG